MIDMGDVGTDEKEVEFLPLSEPVEVPEPDDVPTRVPERVPA
jgi:hypothetical protein